MTEKIRFYRALSHTDWETARAQGRFDGAEHDRRDGFLHLALAGQIRAVLARRYAGRADLVLLEIDPGRLGDPVKYEAARTGELFPHLHGPLPTAAVLTAAPLSLDGEGRHILPATLA